MRRSNMRDETELMDANEPANPMQSLQGYRSPRRLAQWAMMLIGLVAITAALLLVFRVHERNLMVRIAEGDFVFRDPSELEDSDQRIQMTSVVSSIVYVLAGIVFLRWVNFSYRNTLAFGAVGPRYGQSPNWAWIAFFIPILNFFRPAQIAQEMWENAEPDSPDSSGRNDRIVAQWWGSFMAMNITAQLLTRAALNLRTLDDAFNMNAVGILYAILTLVAAGFAIYYLRTLTFRQEQKYVALRRAAASGATASAT